MRNHSCRVCNRNFPNGRSLGGHMRSHLIFHPPPPPTPRLPDSSSSSPSSSFSFEDYSDVIQDPKLLDPSTDQFSSSTVSDTAESSKNGVNPTRPRSRLRSSSSSSSPEDQDLAFSLIMLSRDRWSKQDSKKVVHQCPVCERVFGTGQALGGHKRAHFNADKKIKKKKKKKKNKKKTEEEEVEYSESSGEGKCWRLIDLNLPPHDTTSS